MGAEAIPHPYKRARIANNDIGGCNNNKIGSSAMNADRDESYFLLLELTSQEPTIQNCFKIIESTCLAQGIQLQIDAGKPLHPQQTKAKEGDEEIAAAAAPSSSKMRPNKVFQAHIDRYYVDFCQKAIRSMFTCGFVPWRLRRIQTGDPVPEVVPMGIFTWSIESLSSRASAANSQNYQSIQSWWGHQKRPASMQKQDGLWQKTDKTPDQAQRMAEINFQKQKRFFEVTSSTTVDNNRNSNKNGHSPNHATFEKLATMKGGDALSTANNINSGKNKLAITTNGSSSSSSDNSNELQRYGHHRQNQQQVNLCNEMHKRQMRALMRQKNPVDDEDTKMLRYNVHFMENCGVLEEEVEIYEYIPPTNDITSHSVLYKTVASPFAHVLIDYRNLRQAIIRRGYADAWNTQAKMVCSYNAQKQSMYNLSEGNPITNDWIAPQNRMGFMDDANLPAEMEQNAYTRDAVLETITGAKPTEHRPIVYTLPKNSTLENVPQLQSIQDIEQMQNKLVSDIASIMGIPLEIVGGGYGSKQGSKKSMENSRIFTTNMMNICKHLEQLLTDVYIATYGGHASEIHFTIRATPRIEIASVEDLQVLLECGLVSFDNAMGISNMLLGMDLEQGTGQKANAGQFSRAFVTPQNKKDLIAAASKNNSISSSSSSSSSSAKKK